MNDRIQVLVKWLKQHPLASASAVLVLVLAVTLFFRSSRLSGLEQEQIEAEEEWRRIEMNQIRSARLETHLQEIEELRERIRERLLHPAEVHINYDYFYRIENSSGVRILTINQTGQADPRTAAGLPELSSFSAIGYTLSVEGGFPEVLRFISEVGNGHFLVRVSALNLSATARGGQARLVTANIQCQILGIRDEG